MKLSLATKIFLGFSLVLALFGALSVTAVTQLNAVRNQLNALNRSLLPLDRLAAEMETLQETGLRGLTGIKRFEDPLTRRSLLESNRRSYGRNMQVRLQQAQMLLRRIDVDLPEDEVRFLEEVGNRLDAVGEQVEALDRLIGTAMQELEGSLEELETPAPDGTDAASALEPAGRKLARDVRLLKLALKNRITTRMVALEREESSAMVVILWLAVLSVAVGILVTVLSLLALRPIRRLAEAAQRISQGDFSPCVKVSAQDEFGFLASEFNRMARSLAARDQEAIRQQEQVTQVNRQLRQSSIDLELLKQYNENIIRSVPNGILVADARGVVTILNPAAERLWGLEPRPTVGKTLGELPLAPALERLLQDWDKVLQGKERLVFEALPFPSSPGSPLVDLYVSALVGHDGQSQGVLLIGEDVTDKVHTKQALLNSERLATIGRMSALVAHEIRNPLSSIGLNTEALLDELKSEGVPLSAEAVEILRSIGQEVERLTAVTDEYLRFARLPKPQLVEEDLNALVGSLLRFVEAELTGAGVHIRQQLSPRESKVRVDESQLRQAFLNLLKNSIQSMPDGGQLTVSTEEAGDTVRVRITDTGKGIDPTCLGKIFDPFFTTRDGGTGLGLSLTQQIVSEHGGTIHCESRPGEGTSFVVELPRSH